MSADEHLDLLGEAISLATATAAGDDRAIWGYWCFPASGWGTFLRELGEALGPGGDVAGFAAPPAERRFFAVVNRAIYEIGVSPIERDGAPGYDIVTLSRA